MPSVAVAERALHPHHVPHRGAERAGAVAGAVRPHPADHRGGHRRAAAARTGAGADRHQRLDVERGGEPRHVDLQCRRRIGVLGEAGLWPLAGQHGAGAGVAQRPIALDASQRRAGLVGLFDRARGVEEGLEGGVEGRVGREGRAVDRRHGILVRAGQGFGIGRLGRGKQGQDRRLSVGDAREEQQEGLQVAVLRVGAQAQAALEEQRCRLGQAGEGRCDDAADRGRISVDGSRVGHERDLGHASRPAKRRRVLRGEKAADVTGSRGRRAPSQRHGFSAMTLRARTSGVGHTEPGDIGSWSVAGAPRRTRGRAGSIDARARAGQACRRRRNPPPGRSECRPGRPSGPVPPTWRGRGE